MTAPHIGPILGLVGSFSAESRTRRLIEAAAAGIAARYGRVTEVIGLDDFGPSLGQARVPEDLAPEARALLDRLGSAEALLIGSPVHKGSYAGLFKHVFDLLDPAALTGKPVLLAATGGGEKHALVIEHQLRPLLGFFEAATLPTGLYAAAGDFTAGKPAAAPLLARLERAVAQFDPWLRPLPAASAA